MPETAKEIASKLAEPWQSEQVLLVPEINIRYGSYYFADLLRRFNGRLPLAIAAYNAGPNRLLKWLPNTGNLPADVWVELIPYKETRKYVMSVLAYIVIYQQRVQGGLQKITALLDEVSNY